MAGRFPLYTDADVQGPLVDALERSGWDVVRAIDLYPERTQDVVHFERAAREWRVLVTNDRRIEAIAYTWLAEGRAFRGLVTWPQAHYGRMSVGDIVEQLDELARRDEPFAAYPIIHLKPIK